MKNILIINKGARPFKQFIILITCKTSLSKTS